MIRIDYFEGRIHPETKLNYLASPPLVVAYALAGTMDTDLTAGPLGTGADGQPVYLRDIWPPAAEIGEVIACCLRPGMFTREYAQVFTGDQRWRSLPVHRVIALTGLQNTLSPPSAS
jgi:aconitate hydratase